VAEFLALVHEYDTTGNRAAVALEPGQALVVDGAVHHVLDGGIARRVGI
jgi:hypothetical protein